MEHLRWGLFCGIKTIISYIHPMDSQKRSLLFLVIFQLLTKTTPICGIFWAVTAINGAEKKQFSY
jgi:hypothetical protein